MGSYIMRIKKGVEGQYPKWLNLTCMQRDLIKMLLNELESNDKIIKDLYLENMELKRKLDDLKND